MQAARSVIQADRFRLQNLASFVAGAALLWSSFYFDWIDLLKVMGFAADKLYHPRVQADLAIIRTVTVFIAILSILSGIAFWKGRDLLAGLLNRAEADLSYL